MHLSKKIILLGHFGVGKTSLIRRFVENSFSDQYKVSIGVHISKKVVEIPPDEKISLIIWDLEGTDDLNTIRSTYFLGTHGMIYVFDVNRPTTFQDIHEDLKIIKTKLAKAPLLVVGNKIDLADENDVLTSLRANDIPVNYLSSAKTGGKVEELFVQMAELLHSDAARI